MIKILFAAALSVPIAATMAQAQVSRFSDPPWRQLARSCWTSVEHAHPGIATSGALIYTAAACTARNYPMTMTRSNSEIQRCINRVYTATYNTCWACPPDRVDAVMRCLGAHQ